MARTTQTGSLHGAGKQDGYPQTARLLVDGDAPLDHHIEEIIIALSDLARRQQNEALSGERPID